MQFKRNSKNVKNYRFNSAVIDKRHKLVWPFANAAYMKCIPSIPAYVPLVY